MSIRSIITVSDTQNTFHIYRHYDGEPSAVVPDIACALNRAWLLPRFEAADFGAALVSTMKRVAGDIYLSATGESELVAYRYEVASINGNLHVLIEASGLKTPIFDGTLDDALAEFAG